MIVRLKEQLLVVTAETAEEQAAVEAWATAREGYVFALRIQKGRSFRLMNLGPQPEACREPINITSRSTEPALQLISNFALTPFELDGVQYASVESSWQGLKFPEPARRLEIAPLFGLAAKRAGSEAEKIDTFEYRGQTIRVGTAEHWKLMTAACWAKFTQCEAAKQALLSTGERPLTHRTRRDSKTIPGVIMAEIWMKIRGGLASRKELETEEEETVEFTTP